MYIFKWSFVKTKLKGPQDNIFQRCINYCTCEIGNFQKQPFSRQTFVLLGCFHGKIRGSFNNEICTIRYGLPLD